MGACGEVADDEDDGEGAAEERREEGHRKRGRDLHRWRRHLLACCRPERWMRGMTAVDLVDRIRWVGAVTMGVAGRSISMGGAAP